VALYIFGMATSYEELFSSSALDVVVPDASLKFPKSGDEIDNWFSRLKTDVLERETAFFGKVQ
jgi:hypothetical protein